MQFKVILTRTIEQVAETEIEAEDFVAAELIARKQFRAGELNWDDTEVRYGVTEIHGPDHAEEFEFEEG